MKLLVYVYVTSQILEYHELLYQSFLFSFLGLKTSLLLTPSRLFHADKLTTGQPCGLGISHPCEQCTSCSPVPLTFAELSLDSGLFPSVFLTSDAPSRCSRPPAEDGAAPALQGRFCTHTRTLCWCPRPMVRPPLHPSQAKTQPLAHQGAGSTEMPAKSKQSVRRWLSRSTRREASLGLSALMGSGQYCSKGNSTEPGRLGQGLAPKHFI